MARYAVGEGTLFSDSTQMRSQQEKVAKGSAGRSSWLLLLGESLPYHTRSGHTTEKSPTVSPATAPGGGTRPRTVLPALLLEAITGFNGDYKMRPHESRCNIWINCIFWDRLQGHWSFVKASLAVAGGCTPTTSPGKTVTLRLDGTPDMVLEIMGATSVEKDNTVARSVRRGLRLCWRCVSATRNGDSVATGQETTNQCEGQLRPAEHNNDHGSCDHGKENGTVAPDRCFDGYAGEHYVPSSPHRDGALRLARIAVKSSAAMATATMTQAIRKRGAFTFSSLSSVSSCGGAPLMQQGARRGNFKVGQQPNRARLGVGPCNRPT